MATSRHPTATFDWASPDEEQFDTQGGMAEVDTIIFGRRTYGQFASFLGRGSAAYTRMM